jgi:hypothetical protein
MMNSPLPKRKFLEPEAPRVLDDDDNLKEW